MSSNNQDITEQDLKGGSGPTGFLGSRSISRRKMLGSLAAGTVVLGVPGVAAAQEGGLGRRDGRGRRPLVETADGIPVARMAPRKPQLLLGVRQQHRGRIQGRQVHASSHVSSMALTVSMMSMTN